MNIKISCNEFLITKTLTLTIIFAYCLFVIMTGLITNFLTWLTGIVKIRTIFWEFTYFFTALDTSYSYSVTLYKIKQAKYVKQDNFALHVCTFLCCDVFKLHFMYFSHFSSLNFWYYLEFYAKERNRCSIRLT